MVFCVFFFPASSLELELEVKKKDDELSDVLVMDDTSRLEKLLITTAVYALLSILLGFFLNTLLHHWPTFSQPAIIFLCGIVLCELSFFPSRAALFAPFLLYWLLWQIFEVLNAQHWTLLNLGEYEDIEMPWYMRFVTLGAQVFCALLSLTTASRHKLVVALLSLVFVVAALPPRIPPSGQEDHPAQSELVNLSQSVCFALLYILASIVVACFQVKQRDVQGGAIKLLQSGWCVWVGNIRLLFITAAVVAVSQIIAIYINAEHLRFVRFDYGNSFTANTVLEPEKSKKTESNSQSV